MSRPLRTLAILLLFFNAVSAIGGGAGMITDPSGINMEMPINFLENTPFDSFLVPGIILLMANGVLSLFFAFLVIFKVRGYPWLVLIQGCILLGWLSVQLVMIRSYAWFLHTLYFAVAVGLALTGILMLRGLKQTRS
jgi:hypothetical protein